ncbi:hypothetical protein ACIBO2_26210 [Nonomuraea sp. NPDC050022]|uniref:hypothetical protein n=1 Tax=Nonomuraea sp. NPDC050022 TaxID=3364358 RepID=UPI0037A89933
MTEQTFEATAAAWVRLAVALDQLDDDGMGALYGMLRHWRSNLPAEAAVTVDTLDSLRHLVFAIMADRKGVTVDEITALVADALAGGGEDNG